MLSVTTTLLNNRIVKDVPHKAKLFVVIDKRHRSKLSWHTACIVINTDTFLFLQIRLEQRVKAVFSPLLGGALPLALIGVDCLRLDVLCWQAKLCCVDDHILFSTAIKIAVFVL